MDKDKSMTHAGGFPQPTARYSGFPATGNALVPPKAPNAGSNMSFSHDISRMPENPPKNMGHRRAHSEILTLPDDLNFDSDLGVVGVDGPSFSDETEEDLFSMYLDMDKFNSNSSSATSSFQVGEPSYVAAAMALAPAGAASSVENVAIGSNERPRIRHQHSLSMDGSTTIKPEMLLGSEETPSADSKKALSAAKLAELALTDPKRAKRIWANRQSAARSKERKMRYIAELERKVQALQTDATSLSGQLSRSQRDTNGLTYENSELKLRLQTMEQQVHLQDALNDALKEEIQHLKVLTGQAIPNGGPTMNFTSFGAAQQYHSQNHTMHTLLAAQQFQHLHIHSQKQQHQLQQQQIHLHQQSEDKIRVSMPSSSQKENPSEIKTPAREE